MPKPKTTPKKRPQKLKPKSRARADAAMGNMVSAIESWNAAVTASTPGETLARAATAAVTATGTRVGPLLAAAMRGFQQGGVARGMARMALDLAASEEVAPEPLMPVFLTIPRVEPVPAEGWAAYKQRAADQLGVVSERLRAEVGLQCVSLLSGNALQCRALPGQIAEALHQKGVELAELDPLLTATLMDDSVQDIELPLARMRHPTLDGTGVRVAVLDSGIDVLHPWLRVDDSVSTSGEDIAIPGRHGTHVAGSIASRDSVYGGVAPGVTLLNIKVLDALGRGQHTSIVAGIDAALDRNARILSMSIGFNHLPTWSQGGHGWACADGRCPLCTAVNNAVIADGVLAVVAAGNEHRRAQFLRNSGFGASFDTEIACPGQAIGALTVAAHLKQTFLTAPFSSRGPTAYGTAKPDLAAPGVNITSSIPVRRDAAGQPVPGLTRGELSDSESGTSMATPIVAGAAALVIQKRIAAGQPTAPADIRSEILGTLFRHLAAPAAEVGIGRLSLAGL
jgi:serine protease AprX